MLSLAEISDRLEIHQLLVDYSTAIDQRRFDDLDRVFTRRLHRPLGCQMAPVHDTAAPWERPRDPKHTRIADIGQRDSADRIFRPSGNVITRTTCVHEARYRC
jgi:hypothetical protein